MERCAWRLGVRYGCLSNLEQPLHPREMCIHVQVVKVENNSGTHWLYTGWLSRAEPNPTAVSSLTCSTAPGSPYTGLFIPVPGISQFTRRSRYTFLDPFHNTNTIESSLDECIIFIGAALVHCHIFGFPLRTSFTTRVRHAHIKVGPPCARTCEIRCFLQRCSPCNQR